jgi:hypothetical protein
MGGFLRSGLFQGGNRSTIGAMIKGSAGKVTLKFKQEDAEKWEVRRGGYCWYSRGRNVDARPGISADLR